MAVQSVIIFFVSFASISLAHEESSMESSPFVALNATSGEMEMPMMMTPYFHWLANSDALYLKNWVPRSIGGLIGACIGLFLLAVFDRFLGNGKEVVEAWWRRRDTAGGTGTLEAANNPPELTRSKSLESGSSGAYLTSHPSPLIPPFELKQDLARGGMKALQSQIGFLLMLSVMTYNIPFFASVVMGLGVGEAAFARLGRSGARHGPVAAH